MREFFLAPWVIKKRGVLLGANLCSISVTHLNTAIIPQNKLDYLLQNNYMIDRLIKQKNINGDCLLNVKKFDIPYNWIWLSDGSFFEVASLLKKCLLSFDFDCQWEIATDTKTIVENLENHHSSKPFVIRLSHQEPIDEKIIENLYADLIGRVQMIWVGETTEGTHLGPVVRTVDDLRQYLLATKLWCFSKKLIEFGFKDYWPLLIYPHLIAHPKRVAEAVLLLAEAPSETCFLLEENREVCLWTKLNELEISESDFFKTQFWSKGLIRNFKIRSFDLVGEAYLAEGRTPCKGIDYLEGNSGKGLDSTSALYSCVGESVERFSAWQSNKAIVRFNNSAENKEKVIYTIDQFHPFGDKWENYLESSNIELPLREVRNEFHPEARYFVPECLIPFPYEPSEPRYEVTNSCTAGLAAYSDYKKAVIKGSLELFERDDFYQYFLFQQPGFTLDFSNNSTLLKEPLYNLKKLLDHLKNNSLHYWCVVYNLNSTLPITHCFLFDQKHHFFSRGTRSGYSLLEAVSGSLVEALQIRQQFLKDEGNEIPKGYRDWRTPSVVGEIQAYLEKFQTLPFSDHPMHVIQYSSDLLLNEIKNHINDLQKPLLVADLPCPILGWFAVRVLIPGLTTHQYPSESLGGKKITNPSFKYGIPT